MCSARVVGIDARDSQTAGSCPDIGHENSRKRSYTTFTSVLFMIFPLRSAPSMITPDSAFTYVLTGMSCLLRISWLYCRRSAWRPESFLAARRLMEEDEKTVRFVPAAETTCRRTMAGDRGGGGGGRGGWRRAQGDGSIPH